MAEINNIQAQEQMKNQNTVADCKTRSRAAKKNARHSTFSEDSEGEKKKLISFLKP